MARIISMFFFSCSFLTAQRMHAPIADCRPFSCIKIQQYRSTQTVNAHLLMLSHAATIKCMQTMACSTRCRKLAASRRFTSEANAYKRHSFSYNTPYQMPQMSHYTQQQPQYMQSEGGQPFNMYQGMQSNYPQYLPNVAAQAQPPNSQPSAVPIVDKPQELAPKTKKIIKIINPETHQEVKIDKQTTAKGAFKTFILCS